MHATCSQSPSRGPNGHCIVHCSVNFYNRPGAMHFPHFMNQACAPFTSDRLDSLGVKYD